MPGTGGDLRAWSPAKDAAHLRSWRDHPGRKRIAEGQTALDSRYLAALTIIAILAALRASYAVTMPLFFAAMIVGALWPLKVRLDRWLPSLASYAATILVLVTVLLAFAAAVYISAGQILQAIEVHWADLEREYSGLVRAASEFGIPIAAPERGRLLSFVQAVASNTYSFASYVGFIALLVIFGLPECARLPERMMKAWGDDAARRVFPVAQKASQQIRGYLGTTLFTSVLTGILSAAWALATGLDLALAWGLLNFVLNFIPIVGNIAGIVPPVLYALIQFDGMAMPLLILGGFVVLQLTISNFVYPMLQGRQLSLSPLAILIAMAFWGWLWGLAGALIAVPLTATLVIACRQFDRTRWFAILFSTPDPTTATGPAKTEPSER